MSQEEKVKVYVAKKLTVLYSRVNYTATV